MTAGKRQAVRALQQPLLAGPTAPIVNTPPATSQPQATPARRPAAAARRWVRIAAQVREEAEACAKLASLPVQHEHAAGIDVGDASHWVCVETTPDGCDARPRVPRAHSRTAPARRLAASLRCHDRRPGGHRRVRPRAVPDAAGSRLPRHHHPAAIRPPDQGTSQDRQTRLPVDSTLAQAWLAAVDLPTRRSDAQLARLRPPACQPGASVRPAHPAHAEGAGVDEPQADQGAGRRHRRDGPEDHPGHPGR